MDPQTTDVSQQNPQQQPGLSQVAAALQKGKNVLVTVSTNPSVDELASALGITLLLSKIGKHATAVFSGKIPPAMEFLDPEKTFEDTVDSLRDFIIALDKEKADKLRYKVEDDVVKIFITPYKTVLGEKDLVFSQGDFNVDVVLALGVSKREDLDKAIIAHGRILHDAVVITVTTEQAESALGSINWNDAGASSVAEMLTSVGSSLGADLLDNQISTALLTGIVAETSRFSNDKTSPKVMNIAAQLMAAGANQQLIASNLRQEGVISEPVRSKKEQPHDDEGALKLDHGTADEEEKAKVETISQDGSEEKTDAAAAEEVSKEAAEPEASEVPNSEDDAKKEGASEPVQTLESPELEVPQTEPDTPVQPQHSEEHNDKPSEGAVIENPAPVADPTPLPEPIVPVTEAVSEPELPPLAPAHSAPPMITPLHARSEDESASKPSFGGTLSATTADAEEAKAAEAAREASVNNMALSHDSPAADDTAAALEDARKAVESANLDQPFDPAHQPLEAISSEPLPSAQPLGQPDTSVSALQPAHPIGDDSKEPDPIGAFMQPHSGADAATPVAPPLNQPVAVTPPLPSLPGAAADPSAGLPPLPPLPNTGAFGDPGLQNGLPPLPPLPGQPAQSSFDPSVAMQPQINPGFMQDMPQSQNPWTQAGDDHAAQQAEKDAARQNKMDQMNAQYDQAVDRNRELQGLPPLNNPNGSGLPPVPPASL